MVERANRATRPRDLEDRGNDIFRFFHYDSQHMVKLAEKYIPLAICSLIPAVIALLFCGQFEIARVIYQCTKFISVWCLGSLFIEMFMSIITIFASGSSTSSDNSHTPPDDPSGDIQPLDQNQNYSEQEHSIDQTLENTDTIGSSVDMSRAGLLNGTATNNYRNPHSTLTTTLYSDRLPTTSRGMRSLRRLSEQPSKHKKAKLTPKTTFCDPQQLDEASDTSIFASSESSISGTHSSDPHTFGLHNEDESLTDIPTSYRNIRQRRPSRS